MYVYTRNVYICWYTHTIKIPPTACFVVSTTYQMYYIYTDYSTTSNHVCVYILELLRKHDVGKTMLLQK